MLLHRMRNEINQSSHGNGQQMASFTLVEDLRPLGDVNADDIGPDDGVGT